MARFAEEPGGPGPGREDPDYEVIGGGLVDDQRTGADARRAVPVPPAPAREVLAVAAREAWRGSLKSTTSWWFWLSCVLGTALAWGAASAMVALGESSGWFTAALPADVFLMMAAFLALSAAVLGTAWGFRCLLDSTLATLLAGAIRGSAFATVSGASLLALGISVGGPAAFVAAAVVVLVLEVALFGLIGAGSRACFASAIPGVVLAAALVAFLCGGNVVATILLIPGTTGMDQASVPVNVQRDDSGRIISYLCVGNLRPVEVAHTERVAWLATSNPALLLGSVGAGFESTESNVGWVLSGLQFAADGPSREVPCLGGTSSDGQVPSVPVALTGFALQALVAVLVVVPGRRLAARRRAASPGSG